MVGRCNNDNKNISFSSLTTASSACSPGNKIISNNSSSSSRTLPRIYRYCVVVITLMVMSSLSVGGTVALSTPASASPRVAVIGGTGRLGRATVDLLIQRGIPCRCLVRPTSTIPSSWTTTDDSSSSPTLVEVIRGDLVVSPGVVDPPESIIKLLDGCTHCLALFGSTRKTKLSDFLPWSSSSNDVEDTDLDHPKQVNYNSMKMLVTACQQSSSCKHIIRITGKGEDPTSFFSVLINGFGSMAKGWNYEGEQVLRSCPDIDYTIIRPGIMKEDYPPTGKDGKEPEPEYLALEGNGGNDLKVSVVGYQQIAELVVLCTQLPQSKRVTMAAMNVPGTTSTTLAERIQALEPDSREFPITLIEQHKQAVRDAFIKTSGIVVAILVAVAVKVLLW